MTDAENDQALEGVTITVTGAHEVGAVTGADGAYAFNDVTPGPVTLTASKEGYMTVSGTGTVQAGGTLFFNPQLSALPPASSTGTLIGSIDRRRNDTGPRTRGQVTLSGGIVGASDGNGVFSIVDLDPGTYQVTISAAGYIDQSYLVLITAGNITDIRTVHLTPLPPSTAINGVVTDAGTGGPIRGATITIVETGETVETQADGTYIMGDIGLLDFTVKASATGYDGIAYAVSTSAFGALTVDFTLTRGGFGTLKIISLSSDGESYGANKKALLTATVSNTGDIEEQAVVRAEIIDADGAVVDVATSQEAVVSFAPLTETDTSIEWNTGRYAPGDYIVKVKLIEAGTMGYNDPTGTVLTGHGRHHRFHPGAGRRHIAESIPRRKLGDDHLACG